MEFSNFLEAMYNKIAEQDRPLIDGKPDRKRPGYEYLPENNKEAIAYLARIFPKHYCKNRKIFEKINDFPHGCAEITIFDFACGPFTFAQSILDELLQDSQNFFCPVFKINIYGFDLSEFTLKIGNKMLDKWQKLFDKKGWSLNYEPNKLDFNSDSIKSIIFNWINNTLKSRYIFLGGSAIVSSGFTDFIRIVKPILQFTREDRNIKLFLVFMVPNHYNFDPIKKDVEEIQKDFGFIVEYGKIFESECKKPLEFREYERLVCKNFDYVIVTNKNNILMEYLKCFLEEEGVSNLGILYNKSKRWILGQKFFDDITFSLWEKYLSYISKFLKGHLCSLINERIWMLDVQKGLMPNESNQIYYFSLPKNILSVAILEKIGGILNKSLENYKKVVIFGNRIHEIKRWNWLYQYYIKDYRDFILYEKDKYEHNSYPKTLPIIFCRTDIRKYFYNIDIRGLFIIFKREFEKNLKNLKQLFDIILYLIDRNFTLSYEGLPIGSLFSPILSNIYLSFLDKKIELSDQVLSMGRYMDDIKILFQSQDFDTDKIKNFLKESIKLNDSSIANLRQLEFHLDDSKFIIKNFDKNVYDTEEIEQSQKFNEFSGRFQIIMKQFFDSIVNFVRLLDDKDRCFLYENIHEFYDLLKDFFKKTFIEIDFDKINLLLCLIHEKYRKNEDIKPPKEDLIEFPIKITNYQFSCQEYKNWSIGYQNRAWLFECEEYSEKIYNETIKILNEFKNKIKEPDTKKEYYIRYLVFLLYKLTKIRNSKLYNNDDPIIKELFELKDYYFPISLISLLYSTYNHIDELMNLVDFGLNHTPLKVRPNERVVYSNDIIRIFHQLTKHFSSSMKIRQDYLKKINFWLNYTMELGDSIEKIAITTLIIRLKLFQLINKSKINKWIKNSNDILLLKNLIILYSNVVKNNVDLKIIQQKVLEVYKQDECLMILTLLASKKAKETDFNKEENLYDQIDSFDGIIDIDNELFTLYDAEENEEEDFSTIF